jgi:hypothetical protein
MVGKNLSSQIRIPSLFETHPSLAGGSDRNLRVLSRTAGPRLSAPRPDQQRRTLALVVKRGARRRPEAGEPRLVFCRIPGKTWQSSGGRSSEPAGPPPGRPWETHPAGTPSEAGGQANRAWVFAGFRAKPGKDPRTRARRSSFAPQLPPASGPNQGVLAVQRACPRRPGPRERIKAAGPGPLRPEDPPCPWAYPRRGFPGLIPVFFGPTAGIPGLLRDQRMTQMPRGASLTLTLTRPQAGRGGVTADCPGLPPAGCSAGTADLR